MTGAPGPFDFATAGRIVFGAGRAGPAGELAGLVGGLGGTRALVCTGAHPDRHADVVASLGAPVLTFPVAGEPTVDTVRSAVEMAGGHGADVVVGIGGGSVLDVGKAVAMLLGNGGDPLDYLEVVGRGQPITRPSLPYVAVPTTAGTGAEVTANAVLASPEHGRKASLRSRTMLPAVAVVDPALTLGCPPAVTAAAGLDALTQCLEPFVSVRATPLTDGLAREGLRRAGAGLRAACADGTDLDARTEMSLCSLLGGLSLANAGLGAVHGLAAVVGGMVPGAPHGAVCAALLVPVAQANVRALAGRAAGGDALDRYTEAARLLTGRPGASVADGLEWLAETVDLLGVPPLAALGLDPARAGEVVAKARASSSMRGNPVALTDDELRVALAAALA